MFRIATFNANSIRIRLDAVLEWMAEHNPDVVAIQETKVEDASFPRDAIEESGYQVIYHGQKTHYGVALISKLPPENVRFGMGDPAWPEGAFTRTPGGNGAFDLAVREDSCGIARRRDTSQ